MPKIICPWLNCRYNSFAISDSMKKQIRQGLTLSGSGKCLVDTTINLSLDETEEELLVCDNYEDGAKFDNL